MHSHLHVQHWVGGGGGKGNPGNSCTRANLNTRTLSTIIFATIVARHLSHNKHSTNFLVQY